MMQNPKVDPLPKDDMINHELIRRIDRLQEQNRMLTCEVSRQSNRVTALEHDKRSLIKQLFQHSSSNSLNSNASTLRWNNLCHSIFCESTHSHLENWLYSIDCCTLFLLFDVFLIHSCFGRLRLGGWQSRHFRGHMSSNSALCFVQTLKEERVDWLRKALLKDSKKRMRLPTYSYSHAQMFYTVFNVTLTQ